LIVFCGLPPAHRPFIRFRGAVEAWAVDEANESVPEYEPAPVTVPLLPPSVKPWLLEATEMSPAGNVMVVGDIELGAHLMVNVVEWPRIDALKPAHVLPLLDVLEVTVAPLGVMAPVPLAMQPLSFPLKVVVSGPVVEPFVANGGLNFNVPDTVAQVTVPGDGPFLADATPAPTNVTEPTKMARPMPTIDVLRITCMSPPKRERCASP